MVGADERRGRPSITAVKPPSASGGSATVAAAFASPSTGGRAPSERSVERRGRWMLRERRFFLQQLGERWAPQDTDQTVKKKFYCRGPPEVARSRGGIIYRNEYFARALARLAIIKLR